MSIWEWLFGVETSHPQAANACPTVNPATGLPMQGPGLGDIDVCGSPFGMDIHDTWAGVEHQDFASDIGSGD